LFKIIPSEEESLSVTSYDTPQDCFIKFIAAVENKQEYATLSLYRGASTGLHFFGLLEPWIVHQIEDLPNSILFKHYKFQFKSVSAVQKQLQSLVEKKAGAIEEEIPLPIILMGAPKRSLLLGRRDK